MAITVGIVTAIGIVLMSFEPVYFDSIITLDDILLDSRIDREKPKLKSLIDREELKLESLIDREVKLDSPIELDE